MTLTFKFKINPSRYAKRFGIEIQDDSMDLVLTEDASCCGKVAGRHVNGEAEDAEVSYDPKNATNRNPSKEVEATLKECEAKNPMTCRYHGMTALANDIEGFLRSEGITGNVKVEIIGSEKNDIFCEATVDGVTDSDVPAIKKAMKNFYSQPGVTGDVDDIFEDEGIGTAGFDLNVDKIDLAGRAKRAPTSTSAASSSPHAAKNAQNTPSAASPTLTPDDGASSVQKPQSAVSGSSASGGKTAPLPAQTKKPTRRRSAKPVSATNAPSAAPAPHGEGASSLGNATAIPSESTNAVGQTLNQPPKAEVPNLENGEPVAFPSEPPVKVPPILYTQADIDYIKGLCDPTGRVAKTIRQVNKHIDNGTIASFVTSGSGGSMPKSLQKFKNEVDVNKVRELAAKDPHGQIKRLADLLGEIEKCEQNGWNEKILPDKWDANAQSAQYPNQASKTGSVDFSDYAFDEKKYEDPYASQRKALGNYVPDEEARKSKIEGFGEIAKNCPDKEIAKLASDAMSAHLNLVDMEEAFGKGEELLKPVDKDGYEAFRTVLGREYYRQKKIFDDASSKVAEWKAKQSVMQGSIAETMSSLASAGKKVHGLMKNWQDRINNLVVGARNRLASKFGLTKDQKDKADSVLKMNFNALYKKACEGEISIGNICPGYDFIDMLDKDYAAGCDMTGSNSRYSPIKKNCFGTNENFSRQEGYTAFCRAVAVTPDKFDAWWNPWNANHNRSNHEPCVIFADPKKSVIAVTSDLYDGYRKYGANRDSSCCTLMTDANSCVIGEHLSKEACTEDLTKLNGKSLLRKMGLSGGNEFHPIGGIKCENCLAVKFFRSVPKFTAAQKEKIRKFGITVYDSSGRVVKI